MLKKLLWILYEWCMFGYEESLNGYEYGVLGICVLDVMWIMNIVWNCYEYCMNGFGSCGRYIEYYINVKMEFVLIFCLVVIIM